ncbi:SRPBCC domain-containing protein [Nocardia sp. X0981]
MITVPTGLTKDAGWQIGVSRTLPHARDTVWNYLTSPAGITAWLGAGAAPLPEPGATYRTESGAGGEIRSYRPGERIRLTHGTTTVQVTTTAATANTTVLRFHQERMSSAAERERQRTHWHQVMDRVAAALAAYAPRQR